MGIIYDTYRIPNPNRYEREYNADGTEKHIVCEGARYHVLRYGSDGIRCSEPKCELNRSVPTQEPK